jgi:hypothetical protein
MKMETRIRNEAPMNTINLSSTHPPIGHVASLLEVGTGFNPELTDRENLYLSMSIYKMQVN